MQGVNTPHMPPQVTAKNKNPGGPRRRYPHSFWWYLKWFVILLQQPDAIRGVHDGLATERRTDSTTDRLDGDDAIGGGDTSIGSPHDMVNRWPGLDVPGLTAPCRRVQPRSPSLQASLVGLTQERADQARDRR